MKLSGRSALVAGAGGALGTAITERLLSEGADVVACDRDREHLDALERQLPFKLRERCLCLICDVSNWTDVASLVERTLREQGKIDVLVNNAGVSGVVPVVEMTEQEWDRVLDVNAKSVFLLSKAVLPSMLERKQGAIVNVASQAGRRGEPYTAHYCAAKAAVLNFGRALAWEVAPHVRVNAICPGYIDSAMTRAGRAAYAQRSGESEDDLRRSREAAIPLGCFQTPEDIAAGVCFLASDDARNVTGMTMDVNGGETMN